MFSFVRRHNALASIACASLLCAFGPHPASTAAPSGGASPSCDSTRWTYVYHPDRLTVIQSCKTVTGKIDTFKTEPDGDFHLGLKVTNASLINQKNRDAQHGDLVIEAVCQGNITQKDVIDLGTCANYFGPHFSISRSDIGRTITVTGAYVSDGIHGWLEIHPITTVSYGTAPASTADPTTANATDDQHAHQLQCSSSSVVWVNSRSGLYHRSSSHWYGTTTQGFYMCKSDADKAGYQDAGD